MNRLLISVVCMASLTWLVLLIASVIRVKGWTSRGLLLAFGNRDNLPEPTAFAGRAERAARNTLENFVLFAALALVAQAAGAVNERVIFGANLFLWARIIYIPVYFAGIAFVRTAVWTASIVGLGIMLQGML
ncbi:MAG: MAPEG family protein [Paucibacter sp.]|nr:MAPEG family protein [Roseateles sp.]